ncbi:MAG: hypothetical protein RR085_07505 [Clostridia bacterium]
MNTQMIFPSLSAFAPEEQAAAQQFLTHLSEQIALPDRHRRPMVADFEKALLYYKQQGLSLAQAVARLDAPRLGDFYLKERTDWYPLDTAAKIYPLSMGLKRMMLFRLSCYLKEPVVPEIMQIALTYTIKRFPYFATTIKCGVFWHYVDSTMRRWALEPETKLPCSVMTLRHEESPSLRVVYFGNRVSIEFFHVLSDGTGGAIFLRTMLAEYFRLLGHPVTLGNGAFDVNEAPSPVEWEDAFPVADTAKKMGSFSDKRALQLKGRLSFEKPARVVQFNLPVGLLKQKAKERHVTINTLMFAYLFMACKQAAEPNKRNRKLQIQLPVNMRKYYPVHTLRNFSMFSSIRLHPDEVTSIDDILPEIAKQADEGMSKENLDQTIALSRRLVSLLRFVPLVIKRPIAYLIYGFMSDVVFTSVFSNVGVIQTPPEMAEFIEKFDAMLGPPISNKAVFSLCSYGEHAVLTITKNTRLPDVEEALYRVLCDDGLEPYVEGSK